VRQLGCNADGKRYPNKDEDCRKSIDPRASGYCECGDDASVDQLVTHRPGRMLGSEDPNAEVRYMVVVSEELQRRALERAFELEFDLVAHLDGGEIAFKPLASHPRPLGVGAPIAAQVRKLIRASCDADAAAAAAEGIVCGPASDEAAGDEAAGEAAPAPRRSASETMSLEGTPPSWSEDDESASLSPFSRAATFEAELCKFALPDTAPALLAQDPLAGFTGLLTLLTLSAFMLAVASVKIRGFCKFCKPAWEVPQLLIHT